MTMITMQPDSINVTDSTSTALTGRQVFDVLAHTDKVLVIQTHAGEQLRCDSDLDSCQHTKASFGRFNLGLHVKDDPNQVLSNRAQLLQFINQYLAQSNTVASDVTVQSIHWLNQIHSNKVVVVGETLNGLEETQLDKERYPQQSQLSLTAPSADAQVTAEVGSALAIMTADCVPIALYSESSKQVAAIHAGWQGLANGVIAATYNTLTQSMTRDEHQTIHAWMGVCISQPCYEVSTDVVNKLLAGCADMGMDIDMVRQQIVGHHDNPNKAWLDLPLLARMQLESLGIDVKTYQRDTKQPKDQNNQGDKPDKSDEQNTAYDCSYSNPNYYSYRRMTHLSESSTGRMALLIVKLGE